jgi:tRNA threonylcarbamoyl adenosine modification protein (Sua5/YciO/YrdC/YwlC family)
MILRVHPDNPEKHKIKSIVASIKSGSIVIIPTDSVYAIACDLYNKKAVEKICIIKGIKPRDANFSLLCADLSNLSDFTLNLSKSIFKVIKRNLPGPFTFILNANNNVPKIFDNKKKTIGIRVPEDNIAKAIINELGNPIVVTSLKNKDDKVLEYIIDPDDIHDKFKNLVDLVIDGGTGNVTPSTIVDCQSDNIDILRQGKGELNY